MPAFQNDEHLYFIWAHSCVGMIHWTHDSIRFTIFLFTIRFSHNFFLYQYVLQTYYDQIKSSFIRRKKILEMSDMTLRCSRCSPVGCERHSISPPQNLNHMSSYLLVEFWHDHLAEVLSWQDAVSWLQHVHQQPKALVFNNRKWPQSFSNKITNCPGNFLHSCVVMGERRCKASHQGGLPLRQFSLRRWRNVTLFLTVVAAYMLLHVARVAGIC